jgi:hypothetical protein
MDATLLKLLLVRCNCVEHMLLPRLESNFFFLLLLLLLLLLFVTLTTEGQPTWTAVI